MSKYYDYYCSKCNAPAEASLKKCKVCGGQTLPKFKPGIQEQFQVECHCGEIARLKVISAGFATMVCSCGRHYYQEVPKDNEIEIKCRILIHPDTEETTIAIEKEELKRILKLIKEIE